MISKTPPAPRIHRIVLILGLVCVLVSACVILVGAHKAENSIPSELSQPTGPGNAKIASQFGKLPLSFELNKGQLDESVKFTARGPGYDLFLTATEAVLRVEKARTNKTDASKPSDENVREGTVLRLKLLGANSKPEVEGQDELPGKVNYFSGSDPAKWLRNIPTYKRAYFKDIYPGIDVVYYGKQRELEYDFVIAAGANPKLIRFSIEGANKTQLDKSGRLLLSLSQGEVSLNKPVIYQLDENGGRSEVKGTYVIKGNEVSFKLARFDSSKPLVIDPVLSYSTLLGSGGNDVVSGIAVDSEGSAYLVGTTDSASFPTTPGAFKTVSGRAGAFVTKLNPTGSALVYSTYLTSEGITNGFGIAVDSSRNAHVTGSTSAEDFPLVNPLKTHSRLFKTTDAAANWNNLNFGITGIIDVIAVAPSAPNTVYAGGIDGLFRSNDGGSNWTKLAATGLPGLNFANTMVVDPTNPSVVYVGHFFNLYRTTNGGANWSQVSTQPSFGSAFSVVFDPSTPSTVYAGVGSGVFKSTDSGSTWTPQNTGLPSNPNIRALAIDPSAPATIYAGTTSNGLFKTTNGGGNWTAMNNGMGGGNPTEVSAVVIDPGDPSTIYTGHGSTPGAGGINKSSNGAASWTLLTNGVPNAGVVAMVATSSGIYASMNSNGLIKTTNGGSSWTKVHTGLWSPSVQTLATHPTDPSILYAGTIGSGVPDAFITKLNASGSGLLFSTLLGGNGEEIGNGIAVDGNGNIFIAGQTNSSNLPVVNAVRSTVTYNGNCATGFASKVNPALPALVFSTYLGGGQCDLASSIATDSSGNSYVTGRAGTDFPTANAFQPNLAGPPLSFDAFVTKFLPDGALVYSTYLGGATGNDTGFAVATDASGNAYVTGSTGSSDFPRLNPIQATFGGPLGDAFVTKLTSNGSALVYSTYLGGGGFDFGRDIEVDSANNVYVTGTSTALEFPLVAGSLRTKSPMYKSANGAANWTNNNYGFIGHPISDIVIHPTQTATVYAGTPVGVFKTTNGGRTWSAINNGLSTNRNVAALVIDPATPATLYVAISGIASGNGVYKTTDGGANWVRRSTGIVGTNLPSLAIDPVTPNTLYLGIGCCGSPNRLYKTTDGADNWVPVTTVPNFVPNAIVVDPLAHSTIYVADSVSPGGVYKSPDAGTTWQNLGLGGAPFRTVAVSPLTAGLVYAGSDQALFRSIDGGSSWTLMTGRLGEIVFDPESASTVYLITPAAAFNPQGLLKSTDNGQTWVSVNQGLDEPRVLALAIDPSRTSTLHLASTAATGSDAFVTKINPAGNGFVYSTFIGGSMPTETFSAISADAVGLALDASGNAYVTGSTSLRFPSTPDAYQPFVRGFNDAFISKLSNSYLISGHVLDGGSLPVSGAEVVLSDGASLSTVLTESDGSYQFSGLREGGTFTISASKPHLTMAPANQTFNNLQSDQVLNFTATATNTAFHTINGQVTENGVALAGVSITLSGSQPGTRTTDSNGNYSFELVSGGSYTVTPTKVGFSFGPASQTFNNLNANQTANFVATRQSFVVTNANNHGTGSLREAIVNANANVGPDTIVFNIPGSGVKTISLLISLPDITERVTIDGTTQPGYAGSPLIEIDGLGLGGQTNGLMIKAGNSIIRGLSIGNFSQGAGIQLFQCDNNLIQANYLGVAANGITVRTNSRGILLAGSSNNIIGGTIAAHRNLISGNGNGINIAGNGNVVQGNFIGTSPAGTAAAPNISGITIDSPSTNNLIGGTIAGAGNLISGNSSTAVATNGSGTTIQGNLIGTDVTGTIKIPNENGVQAIGTNMLIGGTTAAARNIISGNQSVGVYSRGVGNKVQGNYIGTDITGALALGNSSHGVVAGETALIGGTEPGARNIIAANGNSSFVANVALGVNNSGTAATVQGNYIGTDVTGTRALGSGSVGISMITNNHVIGGVVAGARNVISGNSIGIQLGAQFSGVTGVSIQGNFIGLNAAGTGPIPNSQQGLLISNSTNNAIGGAQIEAANTIVFNGGPGVSVTQGSGNSIRSNSIFSNNGLGIDLGGNGVSANDINDADSGSNQLQNFPVITGVITTSNSTTIQGSLHSLSNATFQIDFYSSAAVDPSGNGEGAQFFNTTPVTTNGNGDATFNVTFPVGLATGRVITATATDQNGNTSEYSAADSSGANGSVQFSASAINVIEDIGVLAVTVLRNGSLGSLNVDYATIDGTAIAGQDYTAASGTLNFAAGETSKTIQIPIANDVTTETAENFTVVLSNGPSLESLGAPNVFAVTLLDSTTTPVVSVATGASAIEGNAGTTTEVRFTINLSAATGRAVSGKFSTVNFGAFGSASCNDVGADFEITAGGFSFNPGATSVTVPVKVCGDPNAEANEFLAFALSNLIGANGSVTSVTGTILNDDVLELTLEEAVPSRAAALDAIFAIRDPFRVVSIPDWFLTGSDRNTRVAFFARNLQLNPGELPAAVVVRFTRDFSFINVTAESVRPIPNTEFTQVVVRLPNQLTPGTYSVSIVAHTHVSNSGTIRIVP